MKNFKSLPRCFEYQIITAVNSCCTNFAPNYKNLLSNANTDDHDNLLYKFCGNTARVAETSLLIF